jgi:hypothetical protein
MVWEIRCDKLISKEKEEGITSQEKKKKFKGQRNNGYSKNNDYSVYYKFINYLLTLELQMEGSYLNYTYSYFWIFINHLLSIFRFAFSCD